MPRGTIQTFDPERRFGFIESPTERERVFFHLDDLLRASEVQVGQSVEFNVEHSPRGPRASRVRLLA
ncbi:MAG: cold shock domain-containing protein [Candidatus Thermoplasmatota archaeon]|nr:cold shock domain-containing protein [Candidatus Thermoplasmatota archaeon]